MSETPRSNAINLTVLKLETYLICCKVRSALISPKVLETKVDGIPKLES